MSRHHAPSGMKGARSPAIFLSRPLDVRYVVRSKDGRHGVSTDVGQGELYIPLKDARVVEPGWYSIVLSDEDGATFETATDDEIAEARKYRTWGLHIYAEREI